MFCFVAMYLCCLNAVGVAALYGYRNALGGEENVDRVQAEQLQYAYRPTQLLHKI